MRASERLLIEAEAQHNQLRKNIECHAADIDTIGELLAASGRDHIRWDFNIPVAYGCGAKLLLWARRGDERRLLDRLMKSGAAEVRVVEHDNSTIHTLRVPGVTADVEVFRYPEAEAA